MTQDEQKKRLMTEAEAIISKLVEQGGQTLSEIAEAVVQADLGLLRGFIAENPEVTAFVAAEYNVALILARVLAHMGQPITQDMILCFELTRKPVRCAAVHAHSAGRTAHGAGCHRTTGRATAWCQRARTARDPVQTGAGRARLSG